MLTEFQENKGGEKIRFMVQRNFFFGRELIDRTLSSIEMQTT